ncbi:MAG: type III pantothenate kinase [Ruminococcus sp.]|nr:type III pantothenate kinase [Ruminococcus sp.]
MLLAIDIGNTNIVFGCFDGEEILFRERAATSHRSTDLEYANIMLAALKLHDIDAKEITGAAISSVVPSVTAIMKKAVEKLADVKVMVVGPGIKTGLSILIDNPAQLGSDLVVGAVASMNEYPLPLIVIDLGTATTFSVINEKKDFIGGIIMTGMAVSSDALTNKTAQLPRIAFEAPKKVIGTNTVDSMKSGIMFGTASTIDGMIERIEAELGQRCTVIATGGLAGTVIPLCKRDIILDDDLLLKGLLFIYNKNNK